MAALAVLVASPLSGGVSEMAAARLAARRLAAALFALAMFVVPPPPVAASPSPPTPRVVAPVAHAPVLLVSLDGFRWDYVEHQPPESLPELTALRRAGVRAALRPRFVSKTFPNHWSLVTGLDEQTHGVVGNAMFDPATNRSFAMSDLDAAWWDGGEPIWATAARDARLARTYFWPGSEVEIRGVRPTSFEPYDATVPFERRARAAGAWLRDDLERRRASETSSAREGTPSSYKPSFNAVYFEEPDHSGHVHGPESPETRAACRRVDAAVGAAREAAGEDAWRAANVIVVADHGMAPRRADRVVFLADAPCDLPFDELAVVGGDVVLGIWPRAAYRVDSDASDDDASDAFGARCGAERAGWRGTDGDCEVPRERFDPRWAERLVNSVRACHPNVSAWVKSDVPRRFRYAENRRVAPVVVAADEGWSLCASKDRAEDASNDASNDLRTERNRNNPMAWARRGGRGDCAGWILASDGDDAGGNDATVIRGGAHGYDNDAASMRAVFVARGPSFRSDGAVLVGDASDGSDAMAREDESLLTDAYYGGDAGEGDQDDGIDLGSPLVVQKVLAFDNTLVWSIVARAMGMAPAGPGSALADGSAVPATDAALDERLARLLFEEEEEEGARSPARLALAAFGVAAGVGVAVGAIAGGLPGRIESERRARGRPLLDGAGVGEGGRAAFEALANGGAGSSFVELTPVGAGRGFGSGDERGGGSGAEARASDEDEDEDETMLPPLLPLPPERRGGA